MEQQSPQQFKRNIAYKVHINALLSGKPVMESDRIKFLEIGDKQIVRVNIIANIVDKYIQDGEKRFGSLTLDDATGQIKVKTFGDDVEKFSSFSQGDTVLLIGLVRTWNNELYLTPDILKKKDPSFLLVRKLEVEKAKPQTPDTQKLRVLKDMILELVKNAEKEGGIDIEKIILESRESPHVINEEIKKLLEDGLVYEPRPGKLRWLG
ncbi:MAG: OB-fold nucleic acid binding domain-containing protein [Nanoarchaeota archaeon]